MNRYQYLIFFAALSISVVIVGMEFPPREEKSNMPLTRAVLGFYRLYKDAPCTFPNLLFYKNVTTQQPSALVFEEVLFSRDEKNPEAPLEFLIESYREKMYFGPKTYSPEKLKKSEDKVCYLDHLLPLSDHSFSSEEEVIELSDEYAQVSYTREAPKNSLWQGSVSGSISLSDSEIESFFTFGIVIKKQTSQSSKKSVLYSSLKNENQELKLPKESLTANLYAIYRETRLHNTTSTSHATPITLKGEHTPCFWAACHWPKTFPEVNAHFLITLSTGDIKMFTAPPIRTDTANLLFDANIPEKFPESSNEDECIARKNIAYLDTLFQLSNRNFGEKTTITVSDDYATITYTRLAPLSGKWYAVVTGQVSAENGLLDKYYFKYNS